MATVNPFQDIRMKAGDVDRSLNWYQVQIKNLKNVRPNQLMSNTPELTTTIMPGNMYMFFYDPKHKVTLPYYDIFPLIFPIGFQEGGFLGINLHYLPTYLRARLMDALYSTANNDKYDNTTKLKISYDILNGAAKFGPFSACLKKYLWDHVQSQFLYVEPPNWDTALMLPTERFQKATKSQVFGDSIKKVRGNGWV